MKYCRLVLMLTITLGSASLCAQEGTRAGGNRDGQTAGQGGREGRGNPERGAAGREQAEGTPREGMQRDRPAAREEAAARQQRFQARLRELVEQEKLTPAEARELIQLAFPAASREAPAMQRDRPAGGRRPQVDVKDPAEFARLQDKPIFSGPQAGEKLPAFEVTLALGNEAGESFDPVAKAAGKPQVLIFQDPSGVGLRGLVAFSRLLAVIQSKTEVDFDATVVFVGDDPTAITEMAGRLKPHTDGGLVMTISPDGRDGPGSYGLNRSMAMTVLLAKDGKVVHNFVLPQGMLTPDPHVLGGVAQLIGESAEKVKAWLTAAPEREGMRRTSRARDRGQD